MPLLRDDEPHNWRSALTGVLLCWLALTVLVLLVDRGQAAPVGSSTPAPTKASPTASPTATPTPARSSRASRDKPRPTQPALPVSGWKVRYWVEAQAWALTPKAKAVQACESGGGVYANVDPKAVNPTGKYRGAWQMDRNFWASYGGTELATRPDLASRAAQNYVAYRGYVSHQRRLGNGWLPWECA